MTTCLREALGFCDSLTFLFLQYGRSALEIVMKSIVKLDTPLVSPPSDFKGDFFKGVALFLGRLAFSHFYTTTDWTIFIVFLVQKSKVDW